MTTLNGLLLGVLVVSVVLAGTGIAGAVLDHLRPGPWQTTIVKERTK